jgi:KTSC domain
VDEGDALVSVTIAHASRFVARALAAGVKVEGAPAVEPPKSGMVWYDADSSMISAFGYDEAEGILEIAFHGTGVYRYYDVPLHVFEGLHDAASKGSYIRNYIIDMYSWEKKRGRSRK